MQNAWYNTSFVIKVNLLEKLGLKIKYIYEFWKMMWIPYLMPVNKFSECVFGICRWNLN